MLSQGQKYMARDISMASATAAAVFYPHTDFNKKNFLEHQNIGH